MQFYGPTIKSIKRTISCTEAIQVHVLSSLCVYWLCDIWCFCAGLWPYNKFPQKNYFLYRSNTGTFIFVHYGIPVYWLCDIWCFCAGLWPYNKFHQKNYFLYRSNTGTFIFVHYGIPVYWLCDIWCFCAGLWPYNKFHQKNYFLYRSNTGTFIFVHYGIPVYWLCDIWCFCANLWSLLFDNIVTWLVRTLKNFIGFSVKIVYKSCSSKITCHSCMIRL